MAYEFTFTPRFQKHFKDLTVQEKSGLKTSWNSWLRTHPTRHYGQSGFKGQQISLSAASTWIFALFGIMREIK